jgi:DNA-3-methyladenine glycosylase
MNLAKPLPRSFYARDTLVVARELLGAWLFHRKGRARLSGRIVEVEAYVGAEDAACHGHRGLTERTRVMFGEPGHAYVYIVYGVQHCFNAVTEAAGVPAAVLVRALEPSPEVHARTDGPGRLCAALAITKQRSNGLDLCGDELWIAAGEPPSRIAATRRIGVDYAGEWAERPWRFVDGDSLWLSRKLPRKK